MKNAQKITPCLWFDGQAEQAAQFYTSIFKNSKITNVTRYGDAGKEIHGQQPGSVLAVAFELDGQAFTGLNGGRQFKFNEAISLQISCDTQEEVDHFWNQLKEGGDEKAQQCGWLKDKFGLSWQVVPRVLFEMLSSPDAAKSQRAMGAMMQMKKLDVAALQQAYDG
jgi:predicted 3-demethylubiquinone-9 3-methyltransferase (glyoxalase superfamily)